MSSGILNALFGGGAPVQQGTGVPQIAQMPAGGGLTPELGGELGAPQEAPGGPQPLQPGTGGNVLARLRRPGKGRKPGMMDSMAAGLGAKTNSAGAKSPWVAAANEFGPAFSAAYGAPAAAEAAQRKQEREELELMAKLYGLDRQALNDESLRSYRERSLELQGDRNDIARTRAGRPGSPGRSNPLLDETRIARLLDRKAQEITQQMGVLPGVPLSAEQKTQLETALRAERERLNGLRGQGGGGGAPDDYDQDLDPDGDADDQAGADPEAPRAPPAPPARPAPAPAQPAPGATDPNGNVTGAQPAPAPAAAKPAAPSRDQVLQEAIRANREKGIPTDKLIPFAKERYGVDLTPEMFNQ